jgi:hypothetical protein
VELNRTHQLLVCADDVNTLGEDTHTTRKNTTSSKYMVVSHYLTAGQNHNLLIASGNTLKMYKVKIFGNNSKK